jgi:predicted NAD-dependent protein-ADP-ribosyltransferase YbiA (DUF1768 family)
MSILFYNKDQPFYEFSNFYECKIIFEEKEWKSSEHIYQVQKFIHNKEYYNFIANCDTVSKAYTLAKQKKTRFSSTWKVNKNIYGDLTINQVIDWSKNNNISIRPDWESVKDSIMDYILYLKFSQNIQLKNILMSTMVKN